MHRLLEALKHDNLVSLRKLLSSGEIDLTQEIKVGSEYELDEPDEIPLLLYAIQYHASLEAIEILVDAGLDITEVNREGLGALDIAIKYGRLDVLKLCYKHGTSLVESRRKSGITPIMLAASLNDHTIVKYLLANGADIHAPDKYGMRAIDYVKRMGHKSMLEFIENLK